MKKLILSLFSLFSVFAGVPHCLGNPAPEEVRASQPNRERRHGAYSKDNWTVYYEGRKVKGASASSFTDLGGGYGKDAWTVFYRGRKVEGASASSFESLGNGMGKDNWHTYHYGERYDGSALSGERLGGGYSKDSWTVSNPETNIWLANKLMSKIMNTLRFPEGTPEKDRMSIILASYNSGIGHVNDARRLARLNGEDPNSWEVVARYLQLKAQPEYYESEAVKCGRFTGSRQTLAYVNDVIGRYDKYCRIARR